MLNFYHGNVQLPDGERGGGGCKLFTYALTLQESFQMLYYAGLATHSDQQPINYIWHRTMQTLNVEALTGKLSATALFSCWPIVWESAYMHVLWIYFAWRIGWLGWLDLHTPLHRTQRLKTRHMERGK